MKISNNGKKKKKQTEQNYMQPLRTNNLVDRVLIDEIFYQIPEILEHHELFLASLQSRLDNWDHFDQNNQSIGDIFRETVSLNL